MLLVVAFSRGDPLLVQNEIAKTLISWKTPMQMYHALQAKFLLTVAVVHVPRKEELIRLKSGKATKALLVAQPYSAVIFYSGFSHRVSFWGKVTRWRMAAQNPIRCCNWRSTILSILWALFSSSQCPSLAPYFVKTREVQGRPCFTKVRNVLAIIIISDNEPELQSQ